MDEGDRIPLYPDPGDAWLGKAARHLLAACGVTDAAVAEIASGEVPVAPLSTHEFAATGAAGFLERLDESRLSVLCSALAAEAFVDDYIQARGVTHRHTFERLSPAERFAVAPQLLSGSTRFAPGSELQIRILRLFQLRGELVEPLPPFATVEALYASLYERFNPRSALDSLAAVADAADMLAQLYGPPFRPMPSVALGTARALRGRADAASRVPVPDAAELRERTLAAVGFPAEEVIGA